MRQEIANRVNPSLFKILMRTGVEKKTRDGLRREAPHRVRRDAASLPPVQHPLRHEAIGGVEDYERSSIDGSKDVFDQTLVAATLFPDRVTKACCSFGDGHTIARAVPLGLGPGTVRTAVRSVINRRRILSPPMRQGFMTSREITAAS